MEKKGIKYKLEEVPLSKIMGRYDDIEYKEYTENDFMMLMDEERYDIKMLEKDVNENGIRIYMFLWTSDKLIKNEEYQYYVQDGSHRLKVLKDIEIRKGKGRLEEKYISAYVSVREHKDLGLPWMDRDLLDTIQNEK